MEYFVGLSVSMEETCVSRPMRWLGENVSDDRAGQGARFEDLGTLFKFRSFRQAISVQTGRRFRWKPTGRFGPKRHPVADGFWSRLWRTAAA
jgi:hypothetical protein